MQSSTCEMKRFHQQVWRLLQLNAEQEITIILAVKMGMMTSKLKPEMNVECRGQVVKSYEA